MIKAITDQVEFLMEKYALINDFLREASADEKSQYMKGALFVSDAITTDLEGIRILLANVPEKKKKKS